MKTRFLLFCLSLCLALVPRSQAQDDAPAGPPPVRSQEELDQLFGPIALYPDALIALILPASTVPSDVVLAARYLRGNGDSSRVDGQSWDDSVKSLSHYPDVVKWMDENLAWTKQAGEAFASQPADVMNAIQRLRTAARAAGTLVDSPQQTVVMEGDNIEIVPTDPDVIYVPRYDPEVVYISRPGYYHDPFLTYGIGFSTGIWLGYDFDWGRRRLWTIDRRDRERYWREHHDNHDWHGSPRVVPGPSHPRIVEDNHFRHEEWHPRPDFHRTHVATPPVARTDSNRPDNPSHRPPEQRTDARRTDNDHKNDDHRWQRGSNGSNNDRNRPNSNNTGNAPAPAKTDGARGVQPQHYTPSPVPASTPTVTQPTPNNSPRQDRDRSDRPQREARGNDRPTGSQNPQGRVMQLQTPVQPRPAPSAPAVVNREARASQSPPQQTRQYTPSPSQSRSEPSQPRATQSAPSPGRQDNNNGSDRRNSSDDRRDRGPRS